MTNPEILPPHQQLNKLADQDFSELVRVLDDYFQAENSFVQFDVGLENPDLVGYTGLLADVLCDNDASEEAKRISYEALFFAYTVGAFILPRAVHFSNNEYLAKVDEDEWKAHILKDAQEFLSANPTLKELIAAYTQVLDPSCIASEVAESVAAITFMHIEAGSRLTYFEEEISEFDRELNS